MPGQAEEGRTRQKRGFRLRQFHNKIRWRVPSRAREQERREWSRQGQLQARQVAAARSSSWFQEPHRFDRGLNTIKQEPRVKAGSNGCHNEKGGAPFFR